MFSHGFKSENSGQDMMRQQTALLRKGTKSVCGGLAVQKTETGAPLVPALPSTLLKPAVNVPQISSSMRPPLPFEMGRGEDVLWTVPQQAPSELRSSGAFLWTCGIAGLGAVAAALRAGITRHRMPPQPAGSETELMPAVTVSAYG